MDSLPYSLAEVLCVFGCDKGAGAYFRWEVLYTKFDRRNEFFWRLTIGCCILLESAEPGEKG